MELSALTRLRETRSQYREEFYAVTADLLHSDMVRRLDGRLHHAKYTRLRHSVDVAYTSYLLARVLGLDSIGAARAGLLHDLFFHEAEESAVRLTFSHPAAAVQNARQVTRLSPLEENIILGHMWPFTRAGDLPRYRESYLVSMVDKCCAAREMTVSLFSRRERFDAASLGLPDAAPEPVRQAG